MVAITPALRFAIFTVWPPKCVWGHEPITFKQMQVDHLLPKSLSGDDLAQALKMHGLPADFDLEAEENLAPSCVPCNNSKHAKIPPDVPGIAFLLKDAAAKADTVRASVIETATKANVEKLLAQFHALDLSNETIVEALQAGGVQELGEAVAAASPSVHKLQLTSTAAIELDSEGDWSLILTGFGDCPNENCILGDIDWSTYADGDGTVDGGPCNSCGTAAVRCSDCGCETGAFSDEVQCSGCGNTFHLVRDWDSADITDIDVVRPAT